MQPSGDRLSQMTICNTLQSQGAIGGMRTDKIAKSIAANFMFYVQSEPLI